LTTVNINAQDIFLEKQKGVKYKRLSVLDSLNIKEPDFKNVDIELRICHTVWNFEPMNSKFIQITKDKNGQWTGRSYSYFFYNADHYNYKDVVVEYLSLEYWDKVWQTIIEENYLNLPTESDIKQENKPFVLVADGNSYTIEILTKKRYRRIVYNNPEIMYESCLEDGLDCLEYKHFLQLIQLLENKLDF
jgi:hypothetical protein